MTKVSINTNIGILNYLNQMTPVFCDNRARRGESFNEYYRYKNNNKRYKNNFEYALHVFC
jgi:hypothetical protein